MSFKRINITCGAFLCASVILLFFDNFAVLALISAVLIHEAGHLIAMKSLQIKLSNAEICSFGLNIAYDGRYVPYINEIIAAISGPMFNFFAVGMLTVFSLESENEFVLVLTAFNCALCIFNLLPLSILDGGKILYCVISSLFGPFVSEYIRKYMDIFGTFIIFSAGICLFVKTGYNFTLLLASFWLFYVVNTKKL